MEVLKCLIRKTKAKIFLWELLKTSFCAAECHDKMYATKTNTVSGIPAIKNALKIKTKSPKHGSKSGKNKKGKKISRLKILTRSLLLKMSKIQCCFYLSGKDPLTALQAVCITLKPVDTKWRRLIRSTREAPPTAAFQFHWMWKTLPCGYALRRLADAHAASAKVWRHP